MWSRAFDKALIVGFFIAPLAAWIADASVARRREAISVSGLVLALDDRVIASVNAFDNRRPPPLEAQVIGNFGLIVEDRHRGWPLTTSIERAPARIDLDLPKLEAKPRKNAVLAATDPYRVAIEAALLDHGDGEALAAWRQAGPVEHQHWIAWVIAIGVWWLLLLAAAGLSLTAGRVLSQVAHETVSRRRAKLRAQNKCHTCGYDMTGLEFNEKCPECGNLVW